MTSAPCPYSTLMPPAALVRIKARMPVRASTRAGLANHKLSGMTNRGRTRKCRDVGIGNADGVCKIVGKRSQAGAKNEPNLRADLGLRKDKCRGGFGPSVQVWVHEIFRRDAACRVSAEDTCVDSRYCPRLSC